MTHQDETRQALEAVIRDLSCGFRAEAPLPALVDRALLVWARLWRVRDLAWRALRRLYPRLAVDRRPFERPVVAVDLLPLLPGGANGGAKVFTLVLLETMARLAPDWTFVLAANPASVEELAALAGENVVVAAAKSAWQAAPPKKIAGKRIDCWFCPFTRPYFQRPEIPLVSVIYDLQYHYYPQFFTEAERQGRDQTFQLAARRSARLACISHYVRGTVLEQADLPPEKVRTIHITVPSRLVAPPRERSLEILARLGVADNAFFLYPANFWPHKNHAALLTAFGMHLAANPESGARLVLTGADTGLASSLKEAAATMGLADRVLFTGYVTDEELAALTTCCLALVFPSLFEGYGMPVAEAMSLGKPVLCSDLTSLPEVGGDAALYFDPRKPQEIAAAMAQIESRPELAADMAERGRRQAKSLGGPRDMARAYLGLLEEAMRGLGRQSLAVTGLEPDGSAGARVFAAFGAAPGRQWIEAEFALAKDAPTVTCEAMHDGKLVLRRDLAPGEAVRLRRLASPYGGCLECSFTTADETPPQGLACVRLALTGFGADVDLRPHDKENGHGDA